MIYLSHNRTLVLKSIFAVEKDFEVTVWLDCIISSFDKKNRTQLW